MHKQRFLTVCAILAISCAPLSPPNHGAPVPTAEEVEKIRQACPEQPTATPASPRRILIMTQCNGFKHSSVPYCSKAFEILGQKTGAFETVVTDDPRMFSPETLADFDAVVMNNTTMRLPLVATDLDSKTTEERRALEAEEQKLRKGLLDFVRNGKGLVGVHAATDCLYKWPEYGEMIGGYFNGHPWNEDVTVKLDDPAHPLVRAFKGTRFVVKDEIYQFKEPYSREKLRVLLSLDIDRTNMDKGDKIRRDDGDFAVAWIRTYGKGRVFYFSLGHRHEIFWTPPIMAAYLDGIQYAVGDLEADATPSAQLSEAYLKQSRAEGLRAGLEATFRDLAAYSADDDPDDLKRISALVLESQMPGGEDLRSALEDHLVTFLDTPGATADGRRFACRQLSLIGSAGASRVLATQLRDDDVAHMARYALERIPGPEVDAALVASLHDVQGSTLVGVIDSIGVRQCEQAVTALIPLLPAGDADVARAAAFALGRIAAPAGTRALMTALKGRPEDPALATALLDAGGRLSRPDESSPGLAAEAFNAVMTAAAPPHLQAAAFKELAVLRGEAALPSVIAALRKPLGPMTYAAAEAVSAMTGPQVAAAVARVLGNLDPEVQALTVDSLAERADPAALDGILALTDSGDRPVQLACLRALAHLGKPETVGVLARHAAAADDEVAAAARKSLARLQATGVDEAMVRLIPASEAPIKAELVRALGERKATHAFPVMLAAVEDDDAAVSKAAVGALARVAEQPHVPSLVRVLTGIERSSTRSRLETVIAGIGQRADDPAACARAVATPLQQSISSDARCSLLDVLGRIADPAGLDPLYAALDHQDSTVVKAGIKALATWPDAAPMQRLRAVSFESEDPVLRVLALRGYARQLALPSERPVRDTLALYKEAFGLAKGTQEKISLLTGLGNLIHPDAFSLAKGYLDEEELEETALVAACRIMEGLDGGLMKPSASSYGGSDIPGRAIDGTRKTRWTSGAAQTGDEWFCLDLGYETEVTTIMLDAGDTGSDWPREFRVFVSVDGETWGKPVYAAQGDRKIMTFDVTPTYGRHVRIEQTGTTTGNFWSIAEMKVNGRPATLNPQELRLPRDGWTVSASERNDDAGHAVDGDLGERWGTGRGQKPGDWFQIDLGKQVLIRRIDLDAAKSGNDYPRRYRVMVSPDGHTWRGPIALGAPAPGARTQIRVLPTVGRAVRIVQTGDGGKYWWSIYDVQVLGEEPFP